MLSIGEFADKLGVSPVTLRRWDRYNKFKPAHVDGKGVRFYTEEQVEEVMAFKKMDVLPDTPREPKKPRGGNNLMVDNRPLAPGENAQVAGSLLEILSWGEVDRADIKALEERFVKTIQFCIEKNIRVTNQIVYLALGLAQEDVWAWSRGEVRTKAHMHLAKTIKRFCATYREQLGAEGKLNPVTLIWWQKNYDGFVDKSEVVLTPNNALGDTVDPEEVRRRRIANLPTD